MTTSEQVEEFLAELEERETLMAYEEWSRRSDGLGAMRGAIHCWLVMIAIVIGWIIWRAI